MDFDCIYKSYYLDVYHFLCGLSSNKEIAEDITQETFTKALTAINSYDGRKDMQIPLHRITDSASNGSVFQVVTEHFSASSDHAFL